MAFSFADLLATPPVLPPVPVAIGGLDQPLLIHQFTMDQLAEMSDDKTHDGDSEKKLRVQVVKFLNGHDAVVTDEECAALSKLFASWQVREIYHKAMKLNGYGPEAMREAEKN
jgi:hypothetical protein